MRWAQSLLAIFTCHFSLFFLELLVQWVVIHIYNKTMSFSQTEFYWYNLRAYGNLHTNCFMFGIIKMSGQIRNVKHGDIFIPCKFIGPFKN
jgi:hypothetical protein